jgi:HAMP domain-containing protein/HPt (histidine-containing phosphotransfer) domain-containing protein
MSASTEPTKNNPVASRVKARVSITYKLLGLIGLTTGAVVLFLVIYFPAQQIAASHADLQRKAATYGVLVSRQVAPAIAFDDRETAREIFEAVAQDEDVESLELITSKGEVLHAHGVPGAWAENAKQGVQKQVLVEPEGRIGVVAPVVSAEGPRGTLVIELSTQNLEDQKARITRTAMIAGATALVLGMLIAFLIARSLGRRIGSIADTASAVAAGDLDRPLVVDRGHDEITVLAAAFNAMLSQIRSLFAQIKASAEEEQARLGALVRERTHELDTRNQAMRLVLDNVDQGFVGVSLRGQLSPERSAILDRWLGVPKPDDTLFTYIDKTFPGKGDYFRVAWDALGEDWMPLEMRLDQLPSELEHGELHLGFAYQPIFDGAELSRILVIVTDMTPVVEKRRAEEEERELVAVVRKLLADQSGFEEYFREANELVRSMQTGAGDHVSRLRTLHTLKGNSAIFGVESMVRLCHELEGRMQASGSELSVTDVDRLTATWARVRERVSVLLNSRDAETIQIRRVDLQRVVANVNSGWPASQITAVLRSWELESVEPRLRRVADYGRGLAARLEKNPIDIRVEPNDVRLDGDAWSEFWHALVHVMRNAIDHGIESPEERAAVKKPEVAVVALRSRLEGGRLTVEIEDQGRGIDWERVAAVARERGLPSSTHEQLVDALFADGLSTREQASETSGRGVGLSAVREACLRTGGEIEISSTPGRGTLFSFGWSVDANGRPLVYQQGSSRAPKSVACDVSSHQSAKSKVVNAR